MCGAVAAEGHFAGRGYDQNRLQCIAGSSRITSFGLSNSRVNPISGIAIYRKIYRKNTKSLAGCDKAAKSGYSQVPLSLIRAQSHGPLARRPTPPVRYHLLRL